MNSLANGEWHRLHPLSPLLRGGLVLLAVIGFIIANMRERITEIALGWLAPDLQPTLEDEYSRASERAQFAADPIKYVIEHDLVLWATLGVLAVLIAVVVVFWLAWRMRTFRVSADVLEVRGGIVFRSHRSARLDRVQGIDISRPFIPRLFRAAKLQVSVAGQSGNTELAYLSSQAADELRRDLLVLASGARLRVAEGVAPAGAGVAPAGAGVAPIAEGVPPLAEGALPDAATVGGAPTPPDAEFAGAPGSSVPVAAAGASGLADLLARRADEFLAPELDPALAAPDSVVRIPVGRLIGSTLLGGFFIWLLVLSGVLVWGALSRTGWVFLSLVPTFIGIASYLWTRIIKSLRYSIAGTPDGVRIGYGLLSTENRTLPPGRIHAIDVHQWALWRPFGWWSIRVTIAGHVGEASGADQRSLVLPVGDANDVHRVIDLIAPGASIGGLLAAGMGNRMATLPLAGNLGASGAEVAGAVITDLTGAAGADLARATDLPPFSTPSRRARWVRPFTWKRNGWAIADGVLALRRGALLRRVVLVPLARAQSVAVNAGMVGRALRLATFRVHTVAGPVPTTLPAVDRPAADDLFERVVRDATAEALADRSTSWRRND